LPRPTFDTTRAPARTEIYKGSNDFKLEQQSLNLLEQYQQQPKVNLYIDVFEYLKICSYE
jgi:hypothetical protein